MVFGLDKAPDQIKGSISIVDKLLVNGRRINKAATMRCFFPDEVIIDQPKQYSEKGWCIKPS